MEKYGIGELMYLSTCNRAAFFMVKENEPDQKFREEFFRELFPNLVESDVRNAALRTDCYQGEGAIQHLFEVAGSLDSMVIGEREIYRQIKNAYALSKEMGLCGDKIRIAIRAANAVAKKIFTETRISEKSISVVSLAIGKLLKSSVSRKARVLMVGAGATNSTAAKLLRKQGFTDFTVFNRSLENGRLLAEKIGGKSFPLAEIQSFNRGFDVLIACTGATEPTIGKNTLEILLNGEKSKKTIIDLGVPQDVEKSEIASCDLEYIGLHEMQKTATANRSFRQTEMKKAQIIVEQALAEFNTQFHGREIEKAMRHIPVMVKDIREKAVSEVFEKEIAEMDVRSKEVLDEILGYMEKKYISVPMKEAKRVMARGV